MNRSQGQVTTLVLGLATIIIIIGTLMSGRLWGLPLDYERQEHIRLVELALPPFFGILAMALYCATSSRRRTRGKLTPLYATLVVLPPLLVLALFLTLTIAFTYTNARTGGILTPDEFRAGLTMLLSIIACTSAALCLDLYR